MEQKLVMTILCLYVQNQADREKIKNKEQMAQVEKKNNKMVDFNPGSQ